MRGFQLWINLPAREKMKAPAYRDIQPDEIPLVAWPGGGRVKVIAGTLVVDGRAMRRARSPRTMPACCPRATGSR